MKRSLIALAVVVAAPALPGVAYAELTANVAVTSKYKYRGQDQSDDSKAVVPAIQGGFDYSHETGFYVGNWNSSIGFAKGTEMDFYGGYSGEAGPITYDVGGLYYYYPSNEDGLNTTELYGSIGWGPLTAKYSRTMSKRWFGLGDGRGTGYWELNGEYEIATGLMLVGHVGTTQFSGGAKDNGAVNYVDYKIGASFDLGSGFAVETSYVGATKKDDWGDLNKSRVIVTLSKSL